jgi:ligand-binding sensor domain-containing protein
MRTTQIALLLIVAFVPAAANGGSWTTHTNSLEVRDMQIRDGYLWCATRGGVTQWNMSDMTYRKFTTMDGLSTNDIGSIVIGDDGRVWVLPKPYGGVNMYDGEKWIKFTTDDGLPEMNCGALIKDKNGDIWVNTTLGVSRHDGVRWKQYTKADGLPDFDPANRRLFQGANNEVLLFGLDGIFSYDGILWINILPANRLPKDYFYAVAVGIDGAVWCATHTAVMKYKNDTKTVFTSEDGVPDGPKRLFIDDQGVVWAGIYSYGEERGLARYDGTKWETFTKEQGLAGTQVHSLRFDENGNLWAGTDEGLSRFDGDDFETFTPSNEIADNWLRSVFKHGEETWVGTRRGGVSRFDGEVWTTYTVDDNLPDNSVHAVIVDGSGTVWAGTEQGLSRFEGAAWETALESACRCLATGIDSDVWVGTNGDGVFRIRDNESTQYEDVKNHEINCIEVSDNGTVWVGTSQAGVYRFDGSSWVNYTTNDGLKANYIWSLEADENGGLWAGQYLHGVSYFDGHTWFDDNLMKDDSVFSIVKDDDSNLWFGSYKGITLYDGETLVSADRNQGLDDNYVRSIVIDEDGVLWAGTSYGLSTIPVSDIIMIPTGVKKLDASPEAFVLKGIYPNPFNLSTTISFDVQTPGFYSVVLFNTAGQKVRGLFTGSVTAGARNLAWDGRDGNGAPVSSGIYFVRIQSGNRAVTGKATLLK